MATPQEIEALRAAMGAAQVYGKGQYFEEGRYLLEVQKLFYKATLISGVKKENIICEFTVLESTNDKILAGSTRSTVFSFIHQGWMNRFKSLTLALLGIDPDSALAKTAEVPGTQLFKACGDVYVALLDEGERQRLGLPDNFMAKKQVRAEAIPGTSKGKGTPVTNMKWTPVAT